MCFKKVERIKAVIAKNKKNIALNSFTIKEYKKGCEYFNIKDDLNILFKDSIKNTKTINENLKTREDIANDKNLKI